MNLKVSLTTEQQRAPGNGSPPPASEPADAAEFKERVRAATAELQQRLFERDAQLRAVNEELQALCYSLGHDLRAPLRHVTGYVQLLQSEAGPSLSEQCLAHLATIAQSTKNMGSLIDALLDFSRIGLSGMRKTEVDLGSLAQETMRELKFETEGRKIAWEMHPLPPVQADRALLRQAMVNLISNAIKFTRGRNEARIEIGCIDRSADEAVFFVRDNGVGFDPRYARKLFGVFQRLHSAEEFEGTGIGLANVQRIIRRHGGRIWAEGAVGVGATFYFSLPVRQ